MNPFQQSQVWRKLDSRRRRAVMRSLAVTSTHWFHFRLPVGVTAKQVRCFGERNLLRGFFERPARIVTAVTAVQADDGIVLGIALSPHPLNVSLPAWGVSFFKAIKMSFGEVTPISASPIEKK